MSSSLIAGCSAAARFLQNCFNDRQRSLKEVQFDNWPLRIHRTISSVKKADLTRAAARMCGRYFYTFFQRTSRQKMMKGISPMERVIFISGWNDIKAGQLRWYTVRCVGTLFPRSAVTISPKGWFLWKWGSYLNFKRKGVSPTGCWVYRIIAEKRRQDRISERIW